jgi:biotin carboxyl carrier protein
VRFAYRLQPTDTTTVEVEITPVPEQEGEYQVTVGTHTFTLSARLFQRAACLQEAGALVVQYEGQEYRLYDASHRQRTSPVLPGDLRAPMAGTVLRILVQAGDHVQAGDVLLILEAMKMEHHMLAPQAGVVHQLHCRVGERVATGMELMVIEPMETGGNAHCAH